jgi:hypothetical protein
VRIHIFLASRTRRYPLTRSFTDPVFIRGQVSTTLEARRKGIPPVRGYLAGAFYGQLWACARPKRFAAKPRELALNKGDREQNQYGNQREPAAGEDPPPGTDVGAVGIGRLVGVDGSFTGSSVPPPNSPLSSPPTEWASPATKSVLFSTRAMAALVG